MSCIGIDMDGVLACFDKSFTEVLIKTSGRDLFPAKPYDPPCWDWTGPLGYTKQEESAAWNAIKKAPYFWQHLEEYPDAQAIIDRLWDMQLKDNHDVYFVTNRMGQNPKLQTEKWLYERTPTIIPSATVLVSPHKGLCAAAVGLTHYVDDKPSNCDDVVKMMGTKCKVYLLDRSWNQEGTMSGAVQRIKSVHQMLDAVEKEMPAHV